MYTLAITPLIRHLSSSDPAVSQVWYVDDATGVGKCTALWKQWDTLSQLGPLFGYVPNASTIYLVVKDKYAAAARHAFPGTGIVISTDEQRHLGAALGYKDYTATYVSLKVHVCVMRLNAQQRLQISFLMLLMQHLPMDCLVTGLNYHYADYRQY